MNRLLPNGLRLSCGAEFSLSQTQFYPDDGRRQLQARVRPQCRDRVGAREKRRGYTTQ